jgi:Helicase conserved C-terminal domain
MTERSQMIEWMRGEMMGPARPLTAATLATFTNDEFVDVVPLRRGPLAWQPNADATSQEVLYYDRESPNRKYGMGLLHSPGVPSSNSGSPPTPNVAPEQTPDTLGAELLSEELDELPDTAAQASAADEGNPEPADEFEVTSPDVRHPSTLGISFCVNLQQDGSLVVRLPQSRNFFWQPAGSAPFELNGRYESCTRRWTDENGTPKSGPMWRRIPAVLPDAAVTIAASDLVHGRVIQRDVMMPANSPVALRLDVFPRSLQGTNVWLLTVVLRNSTDPALVQNPNESILYQTFFDVALTKGRFEKYPESQRPFGQLDDDEQSLALLYRESATWGIGHGCAAGWDTEPNEIPNSIYADVMPAVQLPSMTPDIQLNGQLVSLSMRSLAALPDNGTGPAWQSLDDLSSGYGEWIRQKREEVAELPQQLREVANRHLVGCGDCLNRINAGIALLREQTQIGARARRAFRLANLSMLLQQIATKQLARRPLFYNTTQRIVTVNGEFQSPWQIYQNGTESSRLGYWRAFQIAFLLMSIDGVRSGDSADREIVDLVWFPTGGGKTEAYLAVVAFYLFHERFLMENGDGTSPRRDGTNVLMRYTLRMLTTQQFQRAASLICAMEYIRRNSGVTGSGNIPGRRFSLGLWIGGDGSPNNCADARLELGKYRRGDVEGNPLVLTECPWCRSEIGRFNGAVPRNTQKIAGITDVANEGPLLHCSDSNCSYAHPNHANWLPVEVIDERLYQHPPSLIIGTADKLAMMAYRPTAGALFGRRFVTGNVHQEAMPPGLIIQDELHLISGPLGTMYALYEGIFERLCSYEQAGTWIKPKLIASTATIRGASEQVLSLYARTRTQLFPNPGLLMGDSFFGKYSRDAVGKLSDGRLYLGIHANDYGSVLTTQVRAFSSALFRPFRFEANRRDPWWTLLAFYNSIRELGGAKTLFDSDIRSRLKFMFNREGFGPNDRRNLRIVEELTSRLSQADIVTMMDRLGTAYATGENGQMLDACLASNIIEVGVDIDRLSLMGIVGQPKTTATYIQVTGRVGRRWWERPGLILMVYNPSKSRDRSHFEQFHSYHRRLYERVEPTTATPFAVSALQRGLFGALLLWTRQNGGAPVQNPSAYSEILETGYNLLRERCEFIQTAEDLPRSLAEFERLFAELEWKWQQNPQEWEKFPPNVNGQYLMLWPGQFYSGLQKRRGAVVPSSMRQVDRSAELQITQGYAPAMPTTPPPTTN